MVEGTDRAGRLLRLGARQLPVQRCSPAEIQAASDWVAVEEPLEIRIAGEPFATVMRTPGHDHELVVGLLLAERVVSHVSELGQVTHCGRPDEGNVMDVLGAPGHALPWPREGGGALRSTIATSACGVCGRQSVEDLVEGLGPRPEGAHAPLTPEAVAAVVTGLPPAQTLFPVCGGVHAAAAWRVRPGAAPELLAAREDVGRHNAVDKVVGRLALDGVLPATELVLAVSGRCGFEIVQKAAVAGFGAVVSISATTSLAVQLAQRVGMTLVSFARAGRYTVYSAPAGASVQGGPEMGA